MHVAPSFVGLHTSLHVTSPPRVPLGASGGLATPRHPAGLPSTQREMCFWHHAICIDRAVSQCAMPAVDSCRSVGTVEAFWCHSHPVLVRTQTATGPSQRLLLEPGRWLWDRGFQTRVDRTLTAVTSHGWLARGHPDPQSTWRKDIGAITGASCVFWDFLSLPQVPRSHAEEVSFRVALASMHVVYSHRKWEVNRILTMAVDSQNSTPNLGRGWCVFESGVSVVGGTETLHSGLCCCLRTMCCAVPKVASGPRTRRAAVL